MRRCTSAVQFVLDAPEYLLVEYIDFPVIGLGPEQAVDIEDADDSPIEHQFAHEWLHGFIGLPPAWHPEAARADTP